MNHNKGGLRNIDSNWFKAVIAHELAHYYFGTYKKFNSVLGDMFTESLAEYLSLKLIKKFLGEDAYFDSVRGNLEELEGYYFKGFKDIKHSADYGDRELYVYTYAPTIWLAIESEIGQELMWDWIYKVLTEKADRTDYNFLIKTLSSVLQNQKMMNRLDEKYFSSNSSVDNAKAQLENK